MKSRYLLVLIPFIILALLFLLYPLKTSGRIIAWTEKNQSDEYNVCIYSTREKELLTKIPGRLIIGNSNNELVCYEYADGIATVYHITNQWSREKTVSIAVPPDARIVALIDNNLYYIDGPMFMCAAENAEPRAIIRLKGEHEYMTNPRPSYDGKWAYYYLSNDEYFIDIFSSSGEIIDTFAGGFHSWYDTTHLLFSPLNESRNLYVYDCETKNCHTALAHNGREYEVGFSTLSTGGLTVDDNMEYLTYSHPRQAKFLFFSLDAPDGMSIEILNLYTGRKEEIKLSAQQSNLHWHIVNKPVRNDEDN